jgi:enterochelin esterase-like enzyme
VAVTAIGECFNYLFDDVGNTDQALYELLQRIHKALDPGGLLLFDVAEPGRVPDSSGLQRTHTEGEDWTVLMSAQEEHENRLLTRRITTFRKVGELYRRDEEIHRLRLVARSELLEALGDLGFEVAILESYGQLQLPPGLTGFLAHKGLHDWVSKGGAAEAMDTLLPQRQVQPMIVVMPTGDASAWGPETGWVDGSQGDWGTYTTRDLVDEIDSKYRTVDTAEGRAIAGNSEGGWAAANLGLKNPSEFGVIGSFSGYFTADEQETRDLFNGDQSLADANSPMSYLPQLEGTLPPIYLLVGQDDRAPDPEENQEFAEELEVRNASYEFDNLSGSHGWDFWRAHLPDFLIFASERLG